MFGRLSTSAVAPCPPAALPPTVTRMRGIRRRHHDFDPSRLARLFPGPRASCAPLRPVSQPSGDPAERGTPKAVPSLDHRASRPPHQDRLTTDAAARLIAWLDDPAGPQPVRAAPSAVDATARSAPVPAQTAGPPPAGELPISLRPGGDRANVDERPPADEAAGLPPDAAAVTSRPEPPPAPAGGRQAPEAGRGESALSDHRPSGKGGGDRDDSARGRARSGREEGGQEETPWIPAADSRAETSGNGRGTAQEDAARGRRSSGHRRLEELPGERLGHAHLGQPGARALVAVGLIAALIAGGYLWQSRPRPQPATETVTSVPAASPTVPADSTPADVTVHVAGKVRKPGVVTLPAGARVADAIRAAGGLRPGTGTGSLNLARRVVDGEQIAVGVPAAPPQAVPPQAAPPGTAGAPAAAPGQPLDLNTATAEQLDDLPGVGPVLAQRIVEYRTRNGGFRSVEQLREVSGIGERRYAELKDLVRV